jgi:hypothetical protein
MTAIGVTMKWGTFIEGLMTISRTKYLCEDLICFEFQPIRMKNCQWSE